MQDIVFYVDAGKSIGTVTNITNNGNDFAPPLMFGVSVCLKMRIFATSLNTDAYPISSFSGVTHWAWRMDSEFNRRTPYKVNADNENITVQTVTETVNGKAMSFTEFSIPISDMNTQELADWLGDNKEQQAELTGELVGYDTSGNAIFGLQVDGFVIRNSLADLEEPTASDQGYLTSSETELLVSSAVAAKQDKLTSANAGAGIAIDSGGTISMSCVILGATNGARIANSNVEADVGSGLRIENGKTVIDDATVKDVLAGIEGGTASINDEVVTPGNLRGALSVGQAVDVTCVPYVSHGSYTTEGEPGLGVMTWTVTTASSGTEYFGWMNSGQSLAKWFPKAAPNLKYLFLADVKALQACALNIPAGETAITGTGNIAENETRRIAFVKVCPSDNTNMILCFSSRVSGTYTFEISNCRQYEVTALTDEAIDYIAKLPDPDAFFRTASVYSLRDKYLVKQDMVCPFIPTISMPDNSDLTVAAGLSYKIKYTNDNPHIITADTIPVDGYGWDTHVQMFIKGTSSIVFQQPLILMDALTPNAGHNLSIKWRNGDALVYVDDTNAGYIVVTASGTGAGTLNFGIVDPGTDYVIFAAALDGTTVDAGTAVFGSTATTLTTLNVLGNGTDKTSITGTIGTTGGKTINLQSLTIDGGTLSGAGIVDITDVAVAAGTTVSCAVRAFINDLDINGTFEHTYTGYDWSIATRVTGIKSTNSSGTLITTSRMFLTGSPVISDVEITGTVTGSLFSIEGRVPLGNIIRINNCYIHDVLGTSNGCWLSLLTVTPTDVRISGCTIANNSCNANNAAGFFRGSGVNVYVTDTILENNSMQLYDNAYMTLGGVITLKGSASCLKSSGLGYGFSNCMLDFTSSTMNSLDGSTDVKCDYTITDTLTIKTNTGVTETIDACTLDKIYTDGRIAAYKRSITITDSGMNPWEATNITFASPLDASAAGTVKLSGTTFTGSAQTLNANRIQLPAATTVSFQGNTNAADTKILEASVILVGDNAAAPSGSATVVNAAGTGSTVSGIGTYIDKEGDNDFVPLTSISTVSTSATSGAGSLPAALTGSNKFVRLGDGTVGTVGEATDAVDKTVMTNAYEPILGGTFSLTSATVDEATKTVAIQSGGAMTIVDVRGGKGSVIDIGGAASAGVSLYNASNVLITGGTPGAMRIPSAAAGAKVSSCIITGNGVGGSYNAPAIDVLAPDVEFVDCVVSGNTFPSGNLGDKDLRCRNAAATIISGCVINGIELRGGNVTLAGSNTIGKIAQWSTTTSGNVTISSGAIINLTSSIAPGGSITLHGGTSLSPTTIVCGGKPRIFEDTEIRGTTITNQGIIYGATVYSKVGDDHYVCYTEDDGTTSSSVIVTGQTEYVVPGGLVQVSGT